MSLAQITMAGSLTTPTVSDDSTLVNSSRRGSSTTPNHSTHEYELNQSDSIDFCFNLMSDPLSNLSQTDIMDIFNVFHKRQTDLQFSVNDNKLTDIQGLKLSKELRRKLDLDRVRIGNRSKRGWFHNLSSSREKVRKVSIL